MKRSRLQFLQRMADWNLRSCNGMLVKVVGLYVGSRRVTITTHRSGISSAASIEIFLRKPMDFIGPKRFHFQTLEIFQCRGLICRFSGHRAGQSTTHSWLLWMFIFENYADPSLDRHRRLIGMRPGTRFFIYGMNGLEVLLQMPASTHGLTSFAKSWSWAKHVASLPAHPGIQMARF